MYVMVNLIMVKRTSIDVVVALTILFCENKSANRKAKYIGTHTQMQHQSCSAYYKDALDSASNHGEEVELRKLIQHIHRKSSQTSQTKRYYQLAV